jgi:tetratricopeptide (TPR) repeat protein
MNSPWDLIKSKQYEEAVRECTRLHQELGGKPNLNNRGIAHLLMRNYAAALHDFQLSIESDPRYRGTTEYCHAGVSSWCLNEPDQAVSIWRAGIGAPYTDAAGGVGLPSLLLYAGCRLGNSALEKEAIGLLKKHWRNHLRRQKRRQERSRPTRADFVHPGLVAWPGATVPFLLGEIDQTQLQQCVDHAGNATLQERWQCAADFYVGLAAVRKGDVQTFQASTQRCAASQKGELEHEYYLARWELDQGFPHRAFSTT